MDKCIKSIITISDGTSSVDCQITDYVYQGFSQNDWEMSFKNFIVVKV